MIKVENKISEKIFDKKIFTEELDKTAKLMASLPEMDMTGWMELPERMLDELEDIKESAKKIQQEAEYLVCLGIGGSYLGSRAVLGALKSKSSNNTQLLFSGNSFSRIEIERVLEQVKGKDFSINVISKSGTTRETAMAFAVFKQTLIDRYGKEEAVQRIYATTDQSKGKLYEEAAEENYKTFVIPDDVGGRYSVLSPVGLLPLAVAGLDVEALIRGAQQEKEEQGTQALSAGKYAALRNMLYRLGYKTEVMAVFEPSWAYMNEWYKQLFGESEGKDNKGIFPASVVYSTDLHSMGQYMQSGRRELFETFLAIKDSDMLTDKQNEQLEKFSKTNQAALEATERAHIEGGVPVIELSLDKWDEHAIGAYIYFMELSCALSALMLGVNPFDQPGVEKYKQKMKEILGE